MAHSDAGTIGTENRVVVMRVGDGTTALTGNTAAVFFEEYEVGFNGQGVPTTATHVQTIPVPTAGATGTRLTLGGTAAAEGGLNFSTNGQYIMFAGYDQNLGLAASGGNARRMVGRLDMSGNLSFDGIYGTGTTASNNAIRSAASLDGNQYWFAQSAAPGIAYRTWEGGNNSLVTATSLNTLNSRRLEISNGQLYVDAASGMIQGVATVGSGVPTTTGQTVTILPGMPIAAGPQPYDFFFADSNTLYVADDRTNANGGLQKWVLESGTWVLKYTKAIGTAVGLRGLAGASVGVDGTVTLFGTTTYGSTAAANSLVGITDSLGNINPANVTVNTLANSSSIPTMTGTLATFRGLETIGIVIPEPGTLLLLALGSVMMMATRRR